MSAFVVGFAIQAAAQIRPIDLGTLGGSYSYASAMSTSGHVVGSSATFDDGFCLWIGCDDHAFLWTVEGGMVDLGTLGGKYSFASAVNASGQVIGDSTTSDRSTHAFSWTAAGGMIDLGTLGGRFSRATAVNASGQVVGTSDTADGANHVFLWTVGDGMIDLGSLGGNYYSEAVAVSASGQVVGESPTPYGVHAFSWTAAGGMIDLGTLGGDFSKALAVHPGGEVLGYSSMADGSVHAFSWSTAQGMVDLGALGNNWASAVAVNASGQMVGFSDTEDGSIQAFSFTPTRRINLGILYGDWSVATAVNASGQVVGNSYLGGEGNELDRRAFSWTAKGGMVRLEAFARRDVDISSVAAVNAEGHAVGFATTATWAPHAALWPVVARTVRPVADTFVRASMSSANFGHAQTLRVKKGTTRRPYLKFDISQITDGDRVTLRLHGNASDSTGPVTATVYAVTDTSWNEHTLTWNTRPALGRVLGSVTVGRDFRSVWSGATAAKWVYVDVTKFVQAERRAGRNMISLALRSLVPSSAFAEFQSREAGDTGPRLVITR